MDCKHKPEVVVEYDDWGVLCKKCGHDIDDYVILTKTQLQLMQDVIEMARKKRKLYKEWEAMKYEGEIDNRFLVFTDKKDAIWKKFKKTLDELDKALDALGGG